MANKNFNNVDIKIEFSEPSDREPLKSGENINSLFGKIKKYFTDLKLVAFSGSYNDLGDKPNIPSVGNGTIVVTQNGIEKGKFTTNQSGNTTIALTDTNTNTTYNAATTSSSGLMTATMVTKLNGIDSNANAYTLPTAATNKLGGVKTTSTVSNSNDYTACPIIDGVPYYKPSVATTVDGANSDIYQDNKIQYGVNSSAIGTSIAWGENTYSDGDFSMSLGYGTTAKSACALAIGSNNSDVSSGTNVTYFSWVSYDKDKKNAFIIGNSSNTTKSNAFRVTYAGKVFALSEFNSSGADYAEFVSEWADGNPNNEDRVGYFVTLKDNKLYKANYGDYILGVTSGNPSVVGNSDETYFWKYERDEFNRFIYINESILDENGNEILDENGNVITGKTEKISDKYNHNQEYIARKDRPEWDYVGMIGVIPVRDDGTCIVNGYCKCGTNGVATIAEDKDFFTYFVKERISDNVINVVVQ